MASGKLAAFFQNKDENKEDLQSIATDDDDDMKSSDENDIDDDLDWVKIDDNSSAKKDPSNGGQIQIKDENFEMLTSGINELLQIKEPDTKETDEKIEKNDINDGKGNDSPKHNAILFTPMPAALPKERIVVVNNLAPATTRYNLIAVFSKYGVITHIHKMRAFALIAFATKEEAQEATKANNAIKILGRSIGVRIRDLDKRFREYPSDQVAFVFNLKPNVSDKVLREHFTECGKIIAMPFYRNSSGINRVLIFKNPGSADIALRLDGSCIDGSKIRVKPRGARAENYFEKRTIILFNENGFTELPKSKILELFSDCGQIVDCDVLCNIKKLAVITFKDEIGAENALKLNDTTVGDIKIRIEPYTKSNYKHTKIIVFNIALDVTTEDIFDFFKAVADIDRIHFVKGRTFALIEFVNTNEYCNAFRLDGENLRGQDLSLKPFSDKDESLENILYGDDDWIAVWGDRAHYRGRRRRNRK